MRFLAERTQFRRDRVVVPIARKHLLPDPLFFRCIFSEGAQMPRHGAGDDFDDDSEITGWHHGFGSRRDRDWGRGDMRFGTMRGGGMMGADGMHSGMMMRMLFAMMDSDGDRTVSLQEFQVVHERIFKAMDANKDGVLTLQEIQEFMRGTRTAAPRQ
jgi:EF hand